MLILHSYSISNPNHSLLTGNILIVIQSLDIKKSSLYNRQIPQHSGKLGLVEDSDVSNHAYPLNIIPSYL